MSENSTRSTGDSVAVMARTKADKKYARANAKNTCTAKLRGKVLPDWLEAAALDDAMLGDSELRVDGAVALELLEEFMGCKVVVCKLKARPPV